MSIKHPGYLNKLVAGCLKGDETSWHQLIELTAPVIFSLCRRNKLSRDESFDIYGQVCLELVGSLERLKDPQSIFAFVGTITRRQIYNFYQKLRVVEYLDDHLPALLPDVRAESIETEIEAIQKREALFRAMDKLPQKYRDLLMILFFDPEEPSYSEIAARLKMPESSIGPLRGKALKQLGRILKMKKYKL